MREKTKRNPWIDCLKLLSCFLVITNHFGSVALSDFLDKYQLRAMGVPIFVFLSFYITADYFCDLKIDWLGKRIKRLYLPVVAWSLIYFIIYNIIRLVLGMETIKCKELLFSIISGVSEKLNPPMWFNVSMIIVTVMTFIFISLCANDNHIIVALVVEAVLLLCSQYLGINVYFWGVLPFEISGTIGRCAEIGVYASLGIIYGKIGILKRKGIILNLLLWGFLIAISFCIKVPTGFGYQGINLLARVIFVCLIFTNLKVEKDNFFGRTINYLAQYTMGVYFMHIGIGWMIVMILKHLGLHMVGGILSIGIFGVSLTLSVLVDNCCLNKVRIDGLVK